MYDESSKRFTTYGTADGLKGDGVYAATPSSHDKYSMLLITNHGFAILNTRTREIRNYDCAVGRRKVVEVYVLCVCRQTAHYIYK
jgi:hypothetical protein